MFRAQLGSPKGGFEGTSGSFFGCLGRFRGPKRMGLRAPESSSGFLFRCLGRLRGAKGRVWGAPEGSFLGVRVVLRAPEGPFLGV